MVKDIKLDDWSTELIHVKNTSPEAVALELKILRLTLKHCLELANNWITVQPDPESDGLSDAPIETLTTINHGRRLKKLIMLGCEGKEDSG